MSFKRSTPNRISLMAPRKAAPIIRNLIVQANGVAAEPFGSPKRDEWEGTAQGILERSFPPDSTVLRAFASARSIVFGAGDSDDDLRESANRTLSSMTAVLKSAVQQLSWEEDGAIMAGSDEHSVSPKLAVFVSHSSRDAALAEALTDLLKVSLALNAQQIRCSSVDGHRLPVGVNTESKLRQEVNAAEVVVGLVTPSSLASSYVMFELGARWGVNLFLAPLLAGVSSADLSGPLSLLNTLSAEIDAQLHQFIGDIADQLELPLQRAETYIRHIARVKELAKNVSSDSLEPVVKNAPPDISHMSHEGRQVLLECSQDPQGLVMCVPDMQGLEIGSNSKILNKVGDLRSQARWKAAIEELVSLGFLERVGERDQIFRITDAGYRESDRFRNS